MRKTSEQEIARKKKKVWKNGPQYRKSIRLLRRLQDEVESIKSWSLRG
jgi:hypothetical protein